MTSSDPPPPPVPAALRTRNQVIAIVGVLVAAAVPVALALGIDLCTSLHAVGIEVAACAPSGETSITALPEPSPRAPGDAGVGQ